MKNKVQNDRNGGSVNEKKTNIKKKGFLGSLLSSAIKGSLFASVLMFDCVLGDVTTDPAAGVANNLFPGGPGAPAIGAGFAPGSFAAYALANAAAPAGVAFAANANGMLGYAYFVTAAGVASPVYVCRKRQAVGVARSNNPANGGHIFNFGYDIHTERQLAIIALGNALGAGLALPVQPPAPPTIATINAALTGAMVAAAGLNGTLHVYTAGSPCPTLVNDNAHFTCFEYYTALATAFPLVNFHIYFPQNQLQLNANFIDRFPAACTALLNEAAGVANNPLSNFTANLLQMNGIQLEYRAANGQWQNIAVSFAGNWHTTAGNQLTPNVAPLPGGITALLVNIINRILSDVTSPIAGREAIFTNIYRAGAALPPNVTFHAI